MPLLVLTLLTRGQQQSPCSAVQAFACLLSTAFLAYLAGALYVVHAFHVASPNGVPFAVVITNSTAALTTSCFLDVA